MEIVKIIIGHWNGATLDHVLMWFPLQGWRFEFNVTLQCMLTNCQCACRPVQRLVQMVVVTLSLLPSDADMIPYGYCCVPIIQ